MIDFHSHFLPEMDDGAKDPEMSIAMLAESFRQNIDVIFATPHFYADEEDPQRFLKRRARACVKLRDTYLRMTERPKIPTMYLGAEVYYFPGIAQCEDIIPLTMGNTKMLLIEPPVAPFTESMLREIESVYSNLGLIPVMAHLDRYCHMLNDYSLFDRVAAHHIDIQVNASFFLHHDTAEMALEMLGKEKFSLMGSDCHNMTSRAPNLSLAVEKICAMNFYEALEKVDSLAYNVLNCLG